ncbi:MULTISPECIES: integrin alpha [Streptomyces]|uniref:Esterase n=1 Tax=Streptomyces dengpaensis TaxID=2049881 RepID=A0ABM6SSZ6_9ACTN|nr:MULTISPECIES: FG-GAP-like repeat-containing protein [Streptomyces]AVH57481.1 esterase [Streptomyces dengpaensis]PIB05608.1 esterase [Streptomyces sp. HG99]
MRTIRKRSAAVAAAAFLLVSGAAITAAPGAYAGTPGGTHANDRNTDFNGDGYDDVLVGAPGATVSGRTGAGLVTVQYGGPKGMGTSNARVFSQNSTGVPGGAESGDGFGRALSTGDLDGDGYDDAIVGVPGEDLGAASNAGGAVVLWGTPKGLSGSGSVWLQSDEPASGGRFGSALAAARFTDTTPGDLLAVLDRVGLSIYQFEAAPTRSDTATAQDAGRQAELATRQTFSAPPAAKSLTAASPDDAPGIDPKALTTGDYDDNGFADLVVSGTSVGAEPGHGWSYVLPGSASDADPLPILAVRGGPVVASGDVNGDGFDDLVTGEPHSPNDGGESMTGGMVGVYYGSASGPAGQEGPGTPPVWWTQDSAGVPGSNERGDGFGADLSVGDSNRDGFADVAIGVPQEDVGSVADAGLFTVLRGSAKGMTATGAWSVTQNTANVPGAAEKGDRFGGQVAFTDPNDDGRFGLLAAAPGENTSDGWVWVFSAGSTGLTTSGSWNYGLGSFGTSGADAQYGGAIDD